ncbi:hypothetical protein HID58_040136 [Brassica napus]|uniref:Uncharacterized protein n=1 Tax=Brassica napus TaxID=3708 RepID=A0ABQ8B7C7_BRANA|nr:hypothetical protein HID58_040136 [Brassica napus]
MVTFLTSNDSAGCLLRRRIGGTMMTSNSDTGFRQLTQMLLPPSTYKHQLLIPSLAHRYNHPFWSYRFVWVVRPAAENDPTRLRQSTNQTEPIDYLPEGFLDRTKDVELRENVKELKMKTAEEAVMKLSTPQAD